MIRNPQGYYNESCKPLYYFGYGLSYTKFEYSSLETEKTEYTSDETISVSVIVKNIGEYDGDEVVQLYFADNVAKMIRPTLELAGFCRVFLKKGESKKVLFRMKVSQTAFLDENMDWIVEKGQVTLKVAASSNDIRLEKNVFILDDAIVDERTRGFYATASVK